MSDQLTRYLIKGRIVTMDAADTVLKAGYLAIDAGRIVAVLDAKASPPPGFETSPVIKTQGTIFPGLIELHNHLSYDILRLWDVPKLFTNRDQWNQGETYRKLITGPMAVLGRTPGYLEAIVRYVECKSLLCGVTTSQGIGLASNAGIKRFYRGYVRNVEQTTEADLPEAGTSIADIEANNAAMFLARLERETCMLLHLSEGVDNTARKHFLSLKMASGAWAIAPSLAGIHSVGLKTEDLDVMQAHGASVIWSPFSNFLLYGKTADVAGMKARGIRIGLGSDWSPSGSKNLLGELKVARLVSAESGGIFTDKELVSMVTREAAGILQWQNSLGSLEPGKRADYLVIGTTSGDPYTALIKSRETNIKLVAIDGTPRYGLPTLMTRFGPMTESLKLGGAKRALNFSDENADPLVGTLTLNEAQKRLTDGLKRLKELAIELENPIVRDTVLGVGEATTQWFLVLNHDEPQGIALRPHLPFGPNAAPTGLRASEALMAAVPLSQLLEPLPLDALTVASDPTFLTRVAGQKNLPDYIKQGLPTLY